MDPALVNNLQWAAATVVYVKVLIGLCEAALSRSWLVADVSRKIIHVGACAWCLFWPTFDISHPSWRLNVTVPLLYSIQLFVKGAILHDSNDPDVKTMSRTGNPTELLYGPFLFTLTMLFCGLAEFRSITGTLIMGALVGDGVAPLVGARYPWGQFRTWGGGTKTVSGSLTMLAGAVLGILWFARLGMGFSSDDVSLATIAQCSLLATVVEGIAGPWDNPAISFAVYALLTVLDKSPHSAVAGSVATEL